MEDWWSHGALDFLGRQRQVEHCTLEDMTQLTATSNQPWKSGGGRRAGIGNGGWQRLADRDGFWELGEKASGAR